jgi:hypothetical protein
MRAEPVDHQSLYNVDGRITIVVLTSMLVALIMLVGWVVVIDRRDLERTCASRGMTLDRLEHGTFVCVDPMTGDLFRP